MRKLFDFGHWRRVAVLAAGSVFAAGILAGSGPATADTGRANKYATTVRYVEEFYPLWFTYYQSLYASTNRLVGPDRISPLYQIVVAINDDTLYASTFLDLTSEPVVLTIPATNVRYSILTLDPYGDIFDSGIPAQTPGLYALTGPDFTGTLPQGVTQIPMPLNHGSIIFRADKYSSTGENEKKAAELFRATLLMQTLSNWQSDPTGGATLILPELFFAAPFKTAADAEIARKPLDFLQQLQAAVAAPNTPPLTSGQQTLSDNFNTLFAKGGDLSAFAAATQTAHTTILQHYLTHTDKNHWINFTDMGEWPDTRKGAIERSGITEFIQYGNNHEAAAYYHAFDDVSGVALDGSDPDGYVLRIPKNKIPQAERFWSFTVYTPETVELVRNKAHKYEIASYTPGLQFGSDGSVTLYFAKDLPAGVPEANWLPIPSGKFNVMLRVYGPEGSVADGTYVPPGIAKR